MGARVHIGARAAGLCVLLALMGPSACGFHPLYANRGGRTGGGTDMPKDLALVRVAAIDDRRGQLLRNNLVNLLSPYGEPAQPRYTLTVSITESMTGLGQQVNSFATLGEMAVNANFVLVDATGVKMSGVSMSTVSVNYLGPRYGSVAEERDAEDRALADIAQDIRDRVAVWLRNPATQPKPTPGAPVVPPTVMTPQALQAQPLDQPLSP